MILTKAACLTAATASYVLCLLPPKSSKSVDQKKNDKVVHENWLRMVDVHKLPIAMASVGILETVLYIVLMVRGPTVSNGIAVQRMRELETWHKVLTALCVAGYALRKWSFIALDRFFTYQLTIRSGHKLIQSGPYTFLRHPSYTGAILSNVGFQMLVLPDGLWGAFVLMLTKVLAVVTRSNSISLPTSFLGVDGGVWLTAAYGGMWVSMLMTRVKNEEAALQEHFGKEWDVYASKRWRFIPFIY
ncbi:hypothetical protein BC939DRAFT_501240 [Gamsiella multidivaricata]|uniref:uncharacterized protein n=1 Tax=Gamsiella multidivaricata TaxID=101098 RepID=UPI00221EE9D4|nr:uncharacterized protein BC939DRAFT_501240 [Gamsiella multidivaricata]KAG0364101.1 hypothetical protein BGZ54_007842 [Gamsiella multidivaricata]KAI7827402.1 hypothetical protein BC939DRAFT_501240 [Gamsiella multidivaricata]